MLKKRNALLLFTLPFLVTLIFYNFGFKFINQIIGNKEVGILVTLLITIYFLVVALLSFKLGKATVALLTIAILALMFLPVRQNISVVSTLKVDSEIFWVERHRGALMAYSANNKVLIKPERLYLTDDTIYEAHLENKDGEVYLVYKKDKDDPYLSKKI
ncbi:hypothetical protein [Idiomarina ramblicola]|uniref:Uncharacterized protein n=1 Tax=Idiomarina ramblicola TaxID=263724 RepID=A0A432Z0I3_9GAMM|nr:hypothetical protein [Idiomarina ramblicola]RUO69698.1 hypothetical protein CWI78_07165 [Idiomarina ramblicola]